MLFPRSHLPTGIAHGPSIQLTWLATFLFSFSFAYSQEAPGTPAAATGSPRVNEEQSTASAAGPASEVVAYAAEWGQNEQIKAFGSTPAVRLRFDIYAKQIREEYRRLMHPYKIGLHEDPQLALDRLEWYIPIRIDLWGSLNDVYKGDSVRVSVELLASNRLQIGVAVKLHDQFDEEKLRRGVLQALLCEPMLARYWRSAAELDGTAVEVPPWLLHGLDQLILHRQGGQRSAYYQGFLNSGQPFDPSSIFKEKDPLRLDPVSLEIFRASASAFVDALLDQEPDGALSLRNMMADMLGASADRVEPLLRQHFPSMRELDQGMQKWWALQLSALAATNSYEYMSRSETERWLAEALVVVLSGSETPDPTATSPKDRRQPLLDLIKRKGNSPQSSEPLPPFSGTISDYEQFIGRPDAHHALVISFGKLQRLKMTAFPLYRPVIVAYEEAIDQLLKGQTKGLADQLKTAVERQAQVHSSLERVEDYLNYYEATSAPSRSDVFNDYIRMRQSLDKQKLPRRTDRITRHLDLIEAEFR